MTATASLQRVQRRPGCAADRADRWRGWPTTGGEADLIPLLRRALNELGPWQLGDGSVRLLLWAKNVRFVLLLDGLNELDRGRT